MANPLKRTSRHVKVRKTLCIVVEGQKTEKNYFTDAKAEFNVGREAVLNVFAATGGSASNILSKAIDQVKLGHDQIWCVLDADTFGTRADFQKLAQARRAKITVIFSNPCFEVWYRHHFTNSHGALANGDEAKAEVKRLMAKHIKSPRSDWRDLRDILASGAPFDNASQVKGQHGIPPAVCLQSNSSSDVDIVLVELGFGPADDDQEGK